METGSYKAEVGARAETFEVGAGAGAKTNSFGSTTLEKILAAKAILGSFVQRLKQTKHS